MAKSNPLSLVRSPDKATHEILAQTPKEHEAWLDHQDQKVRDRISVMGFKAKAGSIIALPELEGSLCYLAGLEEEDELWSFAALAKALPSGRYQLVGAPNATRGEEAALGWALGSYRFERYKASSDKPAELVWPKSCNQSRVRALAEAISLTRDLINTPANDMGPAELAKAAEDLAKGFGAKLKLIEGEQLLKKNFPAIHVVGRASSRAPRLIDLKWGGSGPRLTLVGKGVCFDSGGLDIKSAEGMKMMKKDMGGAAHVLGLASAIMALKLKVRLRVLVPAVENAISGNAFRPLDIIETRQGLSVEVGNTDAEGRLILADALTEACSEKPDLLLDFATLTGAARVALGTELPAMFCNQDAWADRILAAGLKVKDPLWRMPLHPPYKRFLKSPVADLSSTGSTGYGGAITAALFLENFIGKEIAWAHFDIMAWNAHSRLGRSTGAEAMGLRACLQAVEDWSTQAQGDKGKAKTTDKKRSQKTQD